LPNWIGDMVMAVPFLESLRASLTGELWGIGKTSAMHIYHGLGLFDRYLPYDRKGMMPFLDAVNALRGTRFDRGVTLPHSFRSALLLALARVEERIGYARNKRGFMLTRRVAEAPDLLATVEHYLRIIDAMGGERKAASPILAVTADEDERFDRAHTEIRRPYVAFIAGAQYGPSKRWPDRHFSELADMIVNNFDVEVYILPGRNEEKLAGAIRAGAARKDRVQVKSLDIRDLKVCLSRASAVVSNDTGPRHISSALSIPTVVLLGPMDERYTRYPSPGTQQVTMDIPCRPCNKKTCDRDHECLKGITPKEIYMKVENILNGQN
jgi:heptosyltransferase-2